MKKSILLIIFTLFSFSNIIYAESLINCRNGRSASLGDIKHQVWVSCGEPETKEVIGYIDKMVDSERIRVMKIEEWIYAISFYGEKHFYRLVFEGNKLVEINKISAK